MSGAYSQYDPVRARAYQFTAANLGYIGQPVQLSEIDHLAWTLYGQQWHYHQKRQYRGWSWVSLVNEDRQDDPGCFQVAVICQHQLCGLATGRGSQSQFCSIEFIESSPEPHPLKGQITDICVQSAVIYTKLLNRPELRLIMPSARLQTKLLASGHGFSIVSSPGRAQYASILV